MWLTAVTVCQLVSAVTASVYSERVIAASLSEAADAELLQVTRRTFELAAKAPPISLSLRQNSSECLLQVTTLLKGLQSAQNWSLPFADSLGKPPSGLLEGASTWLGSFDECAESSGPSLTGAYCLLQLRGQRHDGQTLRIGSCWPSVCSSSEVEAVAAQLLQRIFEHFHINQTLFVVPAAASCKRPTRELDWTASAIAMLCILCVIGCLLAAGTFADLYMRAEVVLATSSSVAEAFDSSGSADSVGQAPQAAGILVDNARLLTTFRGFRRQPNLAVRLLLCFSVPANTARLLAPAPACSLACANGIRVLSMLWIVLGHTYLLSGSIVSNLGRQLPKWLSSWTFQVVANSTLAVDTFFTLSGLLSAFLFFRELERRQGQLRRVNWLMFYLHRYWRLTPTYMLVLGVYAALGRYLGNGPQFPQEAGGFDPNCRSNWWWNALYINNLHGDVSQMCMPWSWYLACDMQFYAASPLILCSLALHPVFGVALAFGIVLASVTALGVHSTLIGSGAGIVNFAGDYVKPWFRVSPYMIGLLTGRLLLHKRSLRLSLSLAGWVIAACVSGLVLFGLYNSENERVQLPQAVASMYNCLFRLAWSVCVAWTVAACSCGKGGWVNRLLSLQFFAPISRLTFCAYLLHPIIILISVATRRDTSQWAGSVPAYEFCGHLLLTYCSAFAVALTIEAPLAALERIWRSA